MHAIGLCIEVCGLCTALGCAVHGSCGSTAVHLTSQALHPTPPSWCISLVHRVFCPIALGGIFTLPLIYHPMQAQLSNLNPSSVVKLLSRSIPGSNSAIQLHGHTWSMVQILHVNLHGPRKSTLTSITKSKILGGYVTMDRR